MSKFSKALDAFRAVAGAVQTVAPGLANLGPDLKEEIGRQGTRTAMELASVLFSGNGFVQYGPGNTLGEPSRNAANEPSLSPEPQQSHEHEAAGMER